MVTLALAAVGSAAAATAAARRAPNALSYSSASNSVVQPQPRPHSCHARGHGVYSLPDPRCTPGALNPAVSQATIRQTICRSGWTASVRPPESITEREKYASMAAYGDGGSPHDYEYDHLVPLELGGATNDPRNLWPEPGASPNLKDGVEDHLNSLVCDGRLTLAAAQRLIVANWVTQYRAIANPQPATTTPAQSTPRCSASARWNATYRDWDVYVDSNQPDTEAIVTGYGTSASYYTDSAGYADVYFRAGESAAGTGVTVTVGSATCRTTL